MKEKLSREFLDLRKFENPISPIELIKEITSTPNVENDAFYIVDLEDICNKHINWITRLPRVEPHYAIKCNTDPMLLRLLAFLGAGFDCASKSEIQRVLDLGVAPHRIIFANPCKQASYIKYAYKTGVDYMTFDNECELYKIKENHPNAKCVLRIITNDADAVCRFSMKFGADMDTSYALIDTAMKLGLTLAGVSFHVGSGQMSPRAFAESIENARRLFDYAREKHGCRMHLLDLGGGYPGASDSADLFGAIAKEINRALDEFFPEELFDQFNRECENKLRVIAEPGRYYAASAFTLCVSVIAKRIMATPTAVANNEHVDPSKSIMYYINDGVYASFNCLFYDHAEVFPLLLNEQYQAALEGRDDRVRLFKSSIWGPTCDGLDVVVKDCLLPEMQTGEFMVFRNMGAYTISGAVAFNGIPLAKCIYVASTSWPTIKDAFTEAIGINGASGVVGNIGAEDEVMTVLGGALMSLGKEDSSSSSVTTATAVASNVTAASCYSSTCAAAATMAYARAAAAVQQQQVNVNGDEHENGILLLSDETSAQLNEKLSDELSNAAQKAANAVDCAITC